MVFHSGVIGNGLYDLTENVEVNGYILTKKDFQFLESLHQKYKF
jgi:hypothetical protein